MKLVYMALLIFNFDKKYNLYYFKLIQQNLKNNLFL